MSLPLLTIIYVWTCVINGGLLTSGACYCDCDMCIYIYILLTSEPSIPDWGRHLFSWTSSVDVCAFICSSFIQLCPPWFSYSVFGLLPVESIRSLLIARFACRKVCNSLIRSKTYYVEKKRFWYVDLDVKTRTCRKNGPMTINCLRNCPSFAFTCFKPFRRLSTLHAQTLILVDEILVQVFSRLVMTFPGGGVTTCKFDRTLPPFIPHLHLPTRTCNECVLKHSRKTFVDDYLMISVAIGCPICLDLDEQRKNIGIQKPVK